MIVRPDDLQAMTKRITDGAQYDPSHAPILRAFLEVLDRLTPDVVIGEPKERAIFWQKREFIRVVAESPYPQGIGKHHAVQGKDIICLVDMVTRYYVAGAGRASIPVDLTFLTDIELQKIVHDDFVALMIQPKTEQHKMAIVLAGSEIEGMLLFAVEKMQPTNVAKECRGQPYERWTLDCLIQTALMNQLISARTEKACDDLRISRNLIHPARIRRDKVMITSGQAHIAYGAAINCAEELSKNLGPTP